tara:strand:- start:28 stop:249 length:222 start_codon:yes stop_codon:yes gene_type:complete
MKIIDTNIGILNKTPKNNFLLFNNENAQIITLIDAIAPSQPARDSVRNNDGKKITKEYAHTHLMYKDPFGINK